MDNLGSEKKLLISSRPYERERNNNIVQSINKQAHPNIVDNSEVKVSLSPDIKHEEDPWRIQIPDRKYEILDRESNQLYEPIEANKLVEIRKSIQEMRDSIKNRLKIMIDDAKNELKKLDDIENALIDSFTTENPSLKKVHTIFSDFFSDIPNDLIKKVSIGINTEHFQEYPFNNPFVWAPYSLESPLSNFKSGYYQADISRSQESNLCINDNFIDKEQKIEINPVNLTNDIDASMVDIIMHSIIPEKIEENKPLIVSWQKSEILFSDDYKTIQSRWSPDITNKVNILVRNNRQLLMVDGTGQKAYIVDIHENSMKELPNLQIEKICFSLAFIGKDPAVIGGIIPPKNVTSSVEVYDGQQWKSIKSLIIPRSHSRAVKHLEFTFVFGGINGGILNNIEKYQNNTWKVLRIKTPEKMTDFAVVSHESESKILLLGGKPKGKRPNLVFSFDTIRNSFMQLQDLPTDFKTKKSIAVGIYDNTAFLLNIISKDIIKYPIE